MKILCFYGFIFYGYSIRDWLQTSPQSSFAATSEKKIAPSSAAPERRRHHQSVMLQSEKRNSHLEVLLARECQF
jgi:hypothetical protein